MLDLHARQAILDVRGLAKKREKSKGRTAHYASRDAAPASRDAVSARPPKRARTDS
jgi:hypothetical protein